MIRRHFRDIHFFFDKLQIANLQWRGFLVSVTKVICETIEFVICIDRGASSVCCEISMDSKSQFSLQIIIYLIIWPLCVIPWKLSLCDSKSHSKVAQNPHHRQHENAAIKIVQIPSGEFQHYLKLNRRKGLFHRFSSILISLSSHKLKGCEIECENHFVSRRFC